MDNFDKYLNERIQNDNIELNVNSGVFERLKYHSLIKNASRTTVQNSLLPSFTGFFGSKFLAWKLSAAAIFLFVMLGYQQINNNINTIHASDTAQVITNLDTLNLKIINDSVFN